MKALRLLILLVLVQITNAKSQDASGNYGAYKIVFQMSTSDTNAHKALMKQLSNITSESPETKIQVICHGPGLSFIQKDKSVVVEKVNAAIKKGIKISACEFSLKERKVSKEEILPTASYVKAGILELVKLQKEGWYYIKSGF
jgi:intracellular sulfur oxidation DsrE/DsrF family protein